MDKDGHIFMGMAEAHSSVLWDPVQTQCGLRVSIVVTHPAPRLINEINSIELTLWTDERRYPHGKNYIHL